MRDEADSVGAAQFTLHCIGDVRLYRGATDCTPKSKKGRALLAILAAEQRALGRLKIIDLLWSDRQEEQARASLRTLLADLKGQFGEDFDDLLQVDRERVCLGDGVRTDLRDPSLARPAGELFEGLDHIDPELDEWLRAERKRWEKQSPRPAAMGTAAPAFVHHVVPGGARVAIVLIALAAGTLLYLRPWTEPEQPVVAVLPLRDATGQNALLAEGLAEDLRLHLAEREGLQVIGRQSSEVPAVITGGATEAGRMLGATHLVEGSILPGNPARVTVRLVEAANGKVIWNHVAAARPDLVTFGPNGLARLIASQVTETVEQSGPAYAFQADPASYQKLFEARRMLARLDSPDAPKARQLLLSVVEQNPRFAPALAALAEATFRSSNHPFYRGPMPLQQARREAEGYALQAVRLAPEFGPAWLALGQARLDMPEAIKPLRRAVNLSPGSFRARYRLARALDTQGDSVGALLQMRSAVKLEPLDPNAPIMLANYLIAFNARSEMRQLVTDFMKRSDERYDEVRVAGTVAGLLGDYSENLIYALQELALQPANQQAQRSVSVAYVQLAQNDFALRFTQPGSMSAVLLADDLEAVVNKVRELGADFWLLSFETRAAAEYLARKKQTRVLVESYFRAGKALSEDRMGIEALIFALRAEEQHGEANRLLKDQGRWLTNAFKGLPDAVRAQAFAEYFALAGDRDNALTALERSRELDWSWLAGYFQSRPSSPVFAGLRNEPRFHALTKWLEAELRRERREAAAGLRKMGKLKEAEALAKPISPLWTA